MLAPRLIDDIVLLLSVVQIPKCGPEEIWNNWLRKTAGQDSDNIEYPCKLNDVTHPNEWWASRRRYSGVLFQSFLKRVNIIPLQPYLF
jgi:hypothetical protein